MKVDVEVDISGITSFAKRFSKATAEELGEYTERVGRKIEREAKYAMRADVAGPNQARSRTGNLVRQIHFKKGGLFGGVVKAFARYSGKVHGQPYDKARVNKDGRPRKTNPFFTTAVDRSDRFIQQENRALLKRIINRI